MPGTNGAWATTRFVDGADLRHDMHCNIVTFKPGGVIPFVETHVMEHGHRPGGNQTPRCLQDACSLCVAWSGRAPEHSVEIRGRLNRAATSRAGLYVLEGKAVYNVNHDWVEVEAGDFLWLRAFCPQACYAGGPDDFRYMLYKDVNRHARLPFPGMQFGGSP